MCSQVKPISHQLRQLSAVKSRRLLKVLLDSGSTITLINNRCLPKHCKTHKTSRSRMVNTLAGSYNTSEVATIHNLRLPELDKNHKIDHTNCNYRQRNKLEGRGYGPQPEREIRK